MVETTARFALPLLAAAQAHKEITHNEALIRLSGLTHPAIEGAPRNDPPVAPAAGTMWIIGSAPTGAWAQQAHRIALWDAGGWRFLTPATGMLAWNAAEALYVRFDGEGWTEGAWPAKSIEIGGKTVVSARSPAIPDPAGGTMIDVQARAAISGILSAMRTHGLIEVE